MKEPERRPKGEGWVWSNFNFMGVNVWGWKRYAKDQRPKDISHE